MKIDVEGHELHVLKGAAKSLREERPALYWWRSNMVNSFVNLRSYISNFVFTPPDRPGARERKTELQVPCTTPTRFRQAILAERDFAGPDALGEVKPWRKELAHKSSEQTFDHADCCAARNQVASSLIPATPRLFSATGH